MANLPLLRVFFYREPDSHICTCEVHSDTINEKTESASLLVAYMFANYAMQNFNAGIIENDLSWPLPSNMSLKTSFSLIFSTDKDLNDFIDWSDKITNSKFFL